MKAVLCPVCYGKGEIPDDDCFEAAVIPMKTCHGCHGCGWVCVPGDDNQTSKIDILYGPFVSSLLPDKWK